MAIRGGDGSIILTTEVDTTGIKKGTTNIKNATEATNRSAKKLGIELSKALNAGDTKTAQLINNFKKVTEEVDKQSAKLEELKSKLQGLESGQVKIEDKGVVKLQSDFDKATASVQKTQNEINQLYIELENLQSGAFKDTAGNIVFTEKEQAEFNKINARLDELEPKLEANKQKANELGVALRNATGVATQSEIKKTKADISKTENKLEDLTVKAEIAGQKMNGNMNAYHKEVSATEKSVSNLGKRIGRLAASALVFSAMTKLFTSLRENIGNALMANEDFRKSINALQASFWVVSQPIYEAILPGLQALVHWLTIGMLYIATFFSALGGKTLKETMKSAKTLNAQAEAYENSSKSADKSTKSTKKTTKAIKGLEKTVQKANKELSEFDNLIIIGSKSIDTIDTPSVDLSGINSSFDDLESLLSGSELEQLKNFEDWVLSNKDNIKTALEISGWTLLGLAIANAISKITGHGGLLSAFKKKDKGLDTQRPKLQKEAELVRDLSSAWALAPAFAYGMGYALDDLVPQLDGTKEIIGDLSPAFDVATESVGDLIPEISGATESVKLMNPELETTKSNVLTFDSEVSAAMVHVYDSVKESVSKVKTNIGDMVTDFAFAQTEINSLDTVVSKAMEGVGLSVYTATTNASDYINSFKSNSASDVYDLSFNILTNIETAMEGVASAIYTALDNARSNVITFVKVFGGNFSAIADGVKSILTNVTDNMSKAFNWMSKTTPKNKGNDYASVMNEWGAYNSKPFFSDVSNDPFAALATAVTLAPLTGGTSLTGLLKSLPAFARGTVIPPNKEFLAVLGDNKRENEVVSPISTMKQAFTEAMLEMGGNYGGGDVVIKFEGNLAQLGRVLNPVIERQKKRAGTSFSGAY